MFDELRKSLVFFLVVCYNRIICVFCKKEMFEIVMEVFMEMFDKGLYLDINIFYILLYLVYVSGGEKGIFCLVFRFE